mmetsp:Transcript_35413/g.78595  ORF Transcript_35413/g.78595 Transcript_35413/m.78595 type:complete len:85 (+) Transcript_35413:103-357(+)|eukprot:CAMPEP_0202889874 /NCGR_PEP_ID=MMETSP1392-20130828/422_1 /ASSEMBLY_ACC=CAM_ASM_000868 /TAXON_ID=225041 /ORGANISM="Chlamydomonas chlamydogama, Strain SAG 11-48b" /LENGTH=84 /DNA_ID=CAMNT_0049573305 /DNA_START=86 /DNA_END=340 /DNA_ORIENTATION=+
MAALLPTVDIKGLPKNLGETDRLARVGAGTVLAGAAVLASDAKAKALLSLLAVFAAGTAFVSFCPVYYGAKISTTVKEPAATAT